MATLVLMVFVLGETIRQGQCFLVQRCPSCVATMQATANNPTNQDWDADQYRSQYSFVYEYGKSLLDMVDLKAGESVLDVGCGTGVLTAALAASASAKNERGVHAIGMDADPNMIQQAKETFPHIDFFQGDARNFTLENSVDVIFSNAALHWIPRCDMDRAVACMTKSLKSGGQFVVELGGSRNVGKIVAALSDVLQEKHGVAFECPWCFPSISEFTKHMEDNGIEALSAVLYDRPTVLKGGDEGMNHWIRMFAGQFIGKYLDDETLNVVSAKLRQDLYDGEKWIADYRRLRVIGRKR
jgi:trans-aconitate methyltransferase